MTVKKSSKINGKILAFGFVFIAAMHGYAWDTLSEMESESCAALTNEQILVSAEFTNKLHAAFNSQDLCMRMDAGILLAICSHQMFLRTSEESDLVRVLHNASNAVVCASNNTDKWQYWMSKLVFAGSIGMNGNRPMSYCMLTNSICERAQINYTNQETVLERAILDYYEFFGADIFSAYKILAGVNAADLGLYDAATNYASQVPPIHAAQLIEHLESVIQQRP